MNTAVATKKESPVAKAQSFLEKLKPQMALALPKHLNADRMTRLALTAFSTNLDLQNCTPQSLASSIMLAAQLGLEIGVGGQGYLIPYKGTATFVPGWKGLVDLVSRAGRATVWTGAVHDGDRFEYQLGDAPFCKHIPGDEDDSGRFTHVYAIGRVRDAEMPVIEVWTRAKVEKHLKTFNKVGGRHYALASENSLQMYGRKVALLQVLKYVPSSIELHNATTAIHAADAGQPIILEGDFVRMQDDEPEHRAPELPPYEAAEFTKNLPAWTKLVKDGKKTGEALLSMFSTKNTFTPEQQAALKALDAPPPPATDATDERGEDMNAAEGAAK